MGFQATHRPFQKYIENPFAFYGEMDMDITDSLFAQIAVRFEDYEDFGSETVYKVAAKYDFTDTFGLRAFQHGIPGPDSWATRDN